MERSRIEVEPLEPAVDLPRELARGRPLAVVTLFADTPRALAVSPDGQTVYAAAFLSGNRTTSIMERIVTANGGLPSPHTNAEGVPQPTTGLVVGYKVDPTNGNLHWLDNIGRRWDDHVKLSLPDKDVFTINAVANRKSSRCHVLTLAAGGGELPGSHDGPRAPRASPQA